MDKREYWRKREKLPERKEYQRKYKREYMRIWNKKHPLTEGQRKKILLRKYKNITERRWKIISILGGKCIICGYNKCISALELHHRNPKDKENEWRRSVPLDKMLIEAKKCDLLCANCHKELHYKQREILRARL